MSCWTQPDPSLTHTAAPEHVAARVATNFWPLNLTVIRLIRLTLPFLSRRMMERAYETLRACKQMKNVSKPISAGVEFSPARS